MADPVLVIPQRRAALPAAGEFVGQLVVLSSTGAIYRWGSALAWVADGGGGGGGETQYQVQARFFYAP